MIKTEAVKYISDKLPELTGSILQMVMCQIHTDCTECPLYTGHNLGAMMDCSKIEKDVENGKQNFDDSEAV